MWNWQDADWPHFIYKDKFAEAERAFQRLAGMMHGALKYISMEEKEILTIELISDEALKTSEIEGEILNRDSLQSSIRRHFGLKTDHRKIPPTEQGISDMMMDLYRTTNAPLTHDMLFRWHSMLMQDQRDLEQIGAYRRHRDPMQIVSGSVYQPNVHFEAPPSDIIPQEMERFIKWFNASTSLPALIRAGIAHLYFESIHPFEDGNGRIGRAISEKALSQSLGGPTLIALAATIERSKKDYYNALHDNSHDLEISDWLAYFCGMVLAAQERTQRQIDFIIEKGQFFVRLAAKLNKRQEKVLQRMFKEGPDGFKGGLSAENYIKIADTSRATATRDLQDLLQKGALIKTGELRHTRYFLSL